MTYGNVDLSARQVYLNAAPEGIDARYAWRFKGGNGSGNVKFIDIERGWIPTHINVKANRLPCSGFNDPCFQDHGTAVLGIIMMQDAGEGAKGITPEVKGYVVSEWRRKGVLHTASAIRAAVRELAAGDVLLLETQTYYAGKRKKIWPVEVKGENFLAIRQAVNKGIIVIEAAGNDSPCGNDLDLFKNKMGRQTLNVESAGFKDSGAIMVAASSCMYPPAKRDYSNYGGRIDCYALGEKVTTASAYPASGAIIDDYYMHNFGGTSAAAAIVAGAAIAIQSILEANGRRRLTPAEMRSLFRNERLGTPSANGHKTDKIGMMPDLRKIITSFNLLPPMPLRSLNARSGVTLHDA